jgi:Ca-activated chloride channel family protein
VFCQKSFAAEPGDVTSGALMMRARNGDEVLEAVRLGTDIDMTVSGLTVRTRVTQAFRNDTDHWVEAVYVYPLPDDGGVDSLKMVVGKKVIVGEIKKKAEAQAIYDAAKAQGKKAALSSRAVPTCSPTRSPMSAPARRCWCRSSTRPRSRPRPATIPCACRWSSPPLHLADAPPGPPTPRPRSSTRASMGRADQSGDHHRPPAGRLPARPRSAAPPTSTGRRDERGGKRITLANGPVPADRDFELTWRAAPLAAPAVGLFHEKVAGDRLCAGLQLTPPITARETANRAARHRLRDRQFRLDGRGIDAPRPRPAWPTAWPT